MTNSTKNQSTSKSISKSEAMRAFKYAVCILKCEKKNMAKAQKCIKEEGGCNAYMVFNYKINNINEDKKIK